MLYRIFVIITNTKLFRSLPPVFFAVKATYGVPHVFEVRLVCELILKPVTMTTLKKNIMRVVLMMLTVINVNLAAKAQTDQIEGLWYNDIKSGKDIDHQGTEWQILR